MNVLIEIPQREMSQRDVDERIRAYPCCWRYRPVSEKGEFAAQPVAIASESFGHRIRKDSPSAVPRSMSWGKNAGMDFFQTFATGFRQEIISLLIVGCSLQPTLFR